MSRLHSYAMLWRAAVSFARPRGAAVVLWATLLLALASAALSLWFGHVRGALIWSGAILPGGVLLAWAMYFVPNAVKLNTPASAKLMPHMRRRLMELTYLVWIICIAVVAANPHPDPSSVVFSLALAATTTLGIALAAAGYQLGMVVIMVASFGSVYIPHLPAWLVEAMRSPGFLAAELAVFAALGALAVRALFPDGGDAHWRLIDRRKRVQAEQTVGGTARMEKRRLGALWYGKTLRHDCAVRDSRALVLHALGASQHLGEALTTVFTLLATAAGLLLLATIEGPASSRLASDYGWAYASVLLMISMVFSWRPVVLMKATPEEQALLRLAPLMPSTARGFNRHLARALLRRAFAGWSVFAGSALLLTWITGVSGSIMLLQASICCLALPMLAVPLRDHARRAPLAGAFQTLALIGSVILCAVVGAIASTRFGWPFTVVAAGCAVLVAIAAILRGMRVMGEAPCAFPAGRLD
jgi:hypothetical protein